MGVFGRGPCGARAASINTDRGARPTNRFQLHYFFAVVTPSSLNRKLEALVGAEVQRFPITKPDVSGFELLNISNRLHCVDERRSVGVMKWTAADGRPDKVGQYRMVGNLYIVPEKAAGHNLFGIHGWEAAKPCSAARSIGISGGKKKVVRRRHSTGGRARRTRLLQFVEGIGLHHRDEFSQTEVALEDVPRAHA